MTLLDNSSDRVRFAPSPTGQVHIGNIRTAIFNWLFARHNKGEFLVRVEDTDLERSTQDAIDKLFECMAWLGLDYDGEPFYQTKAADKHRAAADKLLVENKAYKPDPKEAGEQVPVLFRIPWDTDNNPAITITGNIELTVHPEEPVTISSAGLNFAQVSKKGKPIPCAAALAGFHELKITNATGECLFDIENEIDGILNDGASFEFTGCTKFAFQRREVQFTDIIKGTLSKPLDTMKDLVIVRGDGSPIFHLANVCDDATQQITCIVRGDDHVENSYRHVLLFQALGFDIPKYAHLPMIVNGAGKPYSKRDGDAFVGDFREKGFLPEALFNYLALLGWSPGDDREKMSTDELAQAFSLERVLSSPARFDFAKLANLNGQYIAEMNPAEFAEQIADFASATQRSEVLGWIQDKSDDFAKVASLMQVRTKTLADVDSWGMFFADKVEYKPKDFRKAIVNPELMPALLGLKEQMTQVSTFSEAEIEQVVRDFEKTSGLDEGKLNRPLRVAVTGSGSGADLMKTLEIIGKEKVIARLESLPSVTFPDN